MPIRPSTCLKSGSLVNTTIPPACRCAPVNAFVFACRVLRPSINKLMARSPSCGLRASSYDPATRHVPAGTPVREVAEGISARLAQSALAAAVGDQMVDLTYPLAEDASVRIITKDGPDALTLYRHSTGGTVQGNSPDQYID